MFVVLKTVKNWMAETWLAGGKRGTVNLKIVPTLFVPPKTVVP